MRPLHTRERRACPAVRGVPSSETWDEGARASEDARCWRVDMRDLWGARLAS